MNEPHLRLFLALPCPLPVAETLSAWCAAHCPGGRPLHPADLHVTLAFLGNQPADQVTRVTEAVAGLPLPAFRLELGTPHRWRDLLVLLPERAPAALTAFQSRLRERLEQAGLPVERRPYRPHLTLARRVSEAPPAATAPQVAWQVREWGLYRSVEGQPRYQRLAGWPAVSAGNSSPTS